MDTNENLQTAGGKEDNEALTGDTGEKKTSRFWVKVLKSIGLGIACQLVWLVATYILVYLALVAVARTDLRPLANPIVLIYFFNLPAFSAIRKRWLFMLGNLIGIVIYVALLILLFMYTGL